MFIVMLNYVQPLSEVDRFVAEHRNFLKENYESGHFLLSGRREPRTGGIILAKADSRAELEIILANDPFQREGVAKYEIVEFVPSMADNRLAHLLGGCR